MEKEDLKNKVIEELEKLRPYLQADGGDMEFVEITEDNIVNIKLIGACGNCPFSMMTLKQGIEQAICKAIPEIEAVEAV